MSRVCVDEAAILKLKGNVKRERERVTISPHNEERGHCCLQRFRPLTCVGTSPHLCGRSKVPECRTIDNTSSTSQGPMISVPSTRLWTLEKDSFLSQQCPTPSS